LGGALGRGTWQGDVAGGLGRGDLAGGLGRRLGRPFRGGLPRPFLQETFSIFGAVLEPQSRGVLIRDKLESRGCQWGLPAVFMGSEEGDLADDAAFFRRSRDIERPFSV